MPDEPILLWPRDGDDPADNPTLTLYRATVRPNGSTVLVCPGGGYARLAEHECAPVGQWLVDNGFHGVVLRYRLGPRHRHPAMIQDAQRAMRLLRANDTDWGLDSQAIAVLGFSAGGHLASTLAVHHNHFHCAQDDLAGQVSARPDACVLVYPAIDMAGAFAHTNCRNNLLGPDPTPDTLDLMSTDRHVSSETPPTFLWHCADDPAVPFENSLRFAEACRRSRVPVEMHIYETGGHGLGLAPSHPVVATWKNHCLAFLNRHLGHAAERHDQSSLPG